MSRTPGTRRTPSLVVSLLVVAVVGCSDRPVKPDTCPAGANPVILDDLHYNEVSFKEVHNSYQRHSPFETALSWNPDEPWRFGCACVEIDLRVNPAMLLEGEYEWNVGHASYSPDPAEALSAYLQRLQAWSECHPGHRVVTVQIDAKDAATDAFFQTYPQAYQQYVTSLPQQLDDYIRRYFDASLLYTPGDMLSGYADLVDAARSKGWPTLGELRGRFIFVFGKTGDDSRLYSDYLPAERLCFCMARFGDEESFDAGYRIFFQWSIRTTERVNGVPWQERARWLRTTHGYFVLRGFNVCQDADEDGDPDCQRHLLDMDEISDGLELWAMATAAGINMHSADLLDEQRWAMVGTTPYWPISRRYWEPEGTRITDLNGATGSNGPAAIPFAGELYVVCDVGGSLKYFTGDGTAWSSPEAIGQASDGRPALAVFQDRLWVASRNHHGRLEISSFDGNVWSDPLEIGPMSENCGMAVYSGALYVVYPDQQSRVAYMSWNGSSWSTSKTARGSTSSAPAVCVFNNRLCVVYQQPDADIARTDFDGSSWSEPLNLGGINGAQASGAPAVVVIGSEMDVIYRGSSGDQLYTFTVREDGHISGQGAVLNGLTSSCVGVCRYDTGVVLIHKDNDSNILWARTMSLGS